MSENEEHRLRAPLLAEVVVKLDGVVIYRTGDMWLMPGDTISWKYDDDGLVLS